MAALDEPGVLEDAPQLELAPLAADVRRAERTRQASGLGLQHLLRLAERAQLLAELRLRRDAALLDFLQLRVDRRQRFAERLDDGLDRLVASVEIGRCGALELAERRACELQEGFVVVLEGVGGQGREGLAQPGFRAFEQAELLGGGRPGGLELCAGARALLPRGEQIFLQPGPGGVALGEQRPTAQRRGAPGARPRQSPPAATAMSRATSRQVQVHDESGFTTLRPLFARPLDRGP